MNGLLTKFVRSRWLDIHQSSFFAYIWANTKSRSINLQKKNVAYIQRTYYKVISNGALLTSQLKNS